MIGLVVTGHGRFAEGLHSSAHMIAGENEHVRYVNFEENMNTDQLSQKIFEAYDQLSSCDGILVLADLPGGTPFKTAVECKVARNSQKIEVVAGTNLPMLVSGVTMLDMADDPIAFAEELLTVGKEYMARFDLSGDDSSAQNEESDGI